MIPDRFGRKLEKARVAGRVKKLGREAGKAFVPRRTASSASFIAAIGSVGGRVGGRLLFAAIQPRERE